MEYKIPLFDLNFDHAEEDAVIKTLRSKWISTGPATAAFVSCRLCGPVCQFRQTA